MVHAVSRYVESGSGSKEEDSWSPPALQVIHNSEAQNVGGAIQTSTPADEIPHNRHISSVVESRQENSNLKLLAAVACEKGTSV
jgi:hypothetical protein